MHKTIDSLGLQVHDNGDIYTIDRTITASNGKTRQQKHRKLNQHKNNYGYYRINASRNGKRIYCLVHRLVYAAFNGLDVYDTSYNIGHLDDNASNNSITNLYMIVGDDKEKQNRNHKKQAYKLLELYNRGLLILPTGYTV